MIKAILFDVDGVLINSFEANLKFFNELLPMFGERGPTREEYKELFHETMMSVIKVFSKSKSEAEVKKIYEKAMSPEMVYDTSLITIPDKAEETLRILRKKYRLGIVTSKEKESVFEVPLLANLREYFEIVIAREDTKEHKPHPEPLLLAAGKMNLASQECVYVGDTRTDVEAAHAAGMKCILYGTSASAKPEAQTRVFEKLPKIIQLL